MNRRKSAILSKDCIQSVAPVNRAAGMASPFISICATSRWTIVHFITATATFWLVRFFFSLTRMYCITNFGIISSNKIILQCHSKEHSILKQNLVVWRSLQMKYASFNKASSFPLQFQNCRGKFYFHRKKILNFIQLEIKLWMRK